ncbi:BamA/TamA family outer membrane protein [Orenia marismortui]|uniref:Surface antigen-like protein n=1 Tax=Orenia marismortui TaxID=46469 RepID=A0A4R8H4B3_9FIRM|nr:BamA/TamA family outer membrane protein [Orenia marismortui]TDX51641.1 surface antigen-like protein [Orenia marismortui]
MKKYIKILTVLVMVVVLNLVVSNLVVVHAEETLKLESEKTLFDKVKELYQADQEAESRNLPFIYYINEAGFMIGDFYYDTNLFNNGTTLTSVLMYAPESGMITSFNDLKDYPVSEKLTFGGRLKIIKYNDIKNGAIGNDSSDEEIPEEYMDALHKFKGLEGDERKFVYGVATGAITEDEINSSPTYKYLYDKNKDLITTLGNDRNKLDGYQLYHGWNNSLALNLTYDINENNAIIGEYNYEELESQVKDYKSDTISLAWENKEVDNKNNPRSGHRVITKVKKSLDLLGHDSHNNWDYTKYTLDARKYFPVFKKSTFAVRMRTQSTTGEKRIDEERTALRRFETGDPEAEVYTYAPFFDMSLLGDLDTMKGYNYYRFYDNNSVLYQAELRVPMDHILTGLQGNLFFEAGRVSDNFNRDLFTEDMHYSGGLGIRYFFNEDVIVRTDIGYSEEAVQFRMNIGQTF